MVFPKRGHCVGGNHWCKADIEDSQLTDKNKQSETWCSKNTVIQCYDMDVALKKLDMHHVLILQQ